MAGISWMEAVFSTTSRHSSSLATPPQPFAILLAARMPRGVAALPRPRRFADTLADTAARVSGSLQALGRSLRRTGRNSRASPAERPQAFMISMTPLQRQRTPAMARLSSMADRAPSSAAFATASRFPERRPKTSESVTIPVQTHAISIIFLHFFTFFAKL